MRAIYFFLFLLIGLKLNASSDFTSKDSLRGGLNSNRTCIDVVHYDLTITFDFSDSSISGRNIISFKVIESSNAIQIDLFENMKVDSVIMDGIKLDYTRLHDAVILQIEQSLIEGIYKRLWFYYHGKPVVAKKAPWDGGFVWSQDEKKRPFIGVACEGLGASSWWPNKDHLSDKPDSMNLSFTVPKELRCVSNGEFLNRELVEKENARYHWKVSYPMINYNATFYIGSFVKIQDYYVSNSDSLSLNYFVLDYNINKAKTHFLQVKPMLKVYEELFGRYPFWKDGYKLVEAPYLGMEHQGAIAYGNEYKSGYLGYQMKGVDFDYVIIHESGHEYWGNSVSMEDIADMWIHEAFCTYSEALYVEKIYGNEMMLRYITDGSKRIKNDKAIIGTYDVNDMGSSDMYMKGSSVLHLLREQLKNDSLWFKTLHEIQEVFKYQSINSKLLFDFLSERLGSDLVGILKYYLTTKELPLLKVKAIGEKNDFTFNWENVPIGFSLAVEVEWKKKAKTILVGVNEKEIELKKARKNNLKINNNLRLFTVQYE